MKHNYKINLIFRLLLISITAGASVGFYITGQLIIAGILLFILLFLFANVLSFQNKIHERISYFFEAILNDDFSLSHKSLIKDKLLEQLNDKMSKVNQKIRQTIIENQQQEHYFRALIDHIDIGILTYDDKGFVIHSNGGIKKLLNIDLLTHLQQVKRYDLKLSEVITKMDSQQQQLITIKEKNKTLLLKATPFMTNSQHSCCLPFKTLTNSWMKKS